jgi:RES domain-containing protein
MRLYRLTPGRFAHDMTGEGARLYGGRWSPPGIPVIHTAESAALAALEFLVHQQSLSALPRDIRLVVFELDDSASITTLPLTDLQPNWDHYMPPTSLQEIGHAWASAATSVALRVPSAVVSQGVERNVLINPQHPDFNRFQLVEITTFRFDERLGG